MEPADATFGPRHPVERRTFMAMIAGTLLAAPLAAEAQQTGKVYQVGVVLEGGPYTAAVEGLKAGLKDLGFEEGKQFALHVRDVKGDPKAVGPAARSLAGEKVDLLYAVSTSLTPAAQDATAH